MTFDQAVINLARRKSGKDIPDNAVVYSYLGGEEQGTEYTPDWRGEILIRVTWPIEPVLMRGFLAYWGNWEATYDYLPNLWADLMRTTEADE